VSTSSPRFVFDAKQGDKRVTTLSLDHLLSHHRNRRANRGPSSRGQL